VGEEASTAARGRTREIGIFSVTLVLAFMLEGLAFARQTQDKSTQQKAPPPQALKHEVSVTLKLIQVTVTDRAGKPVTDLRREDFILFDNGKRQNLTEFERHDMALPAEKEQPPGTRVVSTPAPSPRLMNRRILLFFDFTYCDWRGARKAAEAALHLLDAKLLPTDEVGVLSCSGQRSLQVHQWLTNDREKVRRILQVFGLHNAAESGLDAEEKYQQDLKAGGFADARPEKKTSYQSAAAKPEPKFRLGGMERWIARNYMWSLKALAQALRYLPGQKTLVLFSGGIPGPLINREPVSKSERSSLDLSVYNPLEDMNMDLRRTYSDLCAELADANVAVYAVSTDPLNPASESKTGAATLREMANTTGGQFFPNIYYVDQHLEKVNILTGTYYVLGYPVSGTWDGKYHKISVQVRRPGCAVRAQAGYFNPKPFADYSDTEKLIQLVDLALAENPLSQAPVRFSLRAIPLGSGPPDNLGFVAEVPLDRLGEVAGPKVEVNSLVFNSGEAIIDSRRFEADLTAPGKSSAYLFARLSAPPGEYKCRVVLRNMETGRAAVAAAAGTIQAAGGSGLRLFPPLILVPAEGTVYLAEGRSRPADAKGGPAALAKTYLFDPSRFAPYLEKSLKPNSEVYAGLRCAGAGGAKLEISALLVDAATGDETAVPVEVLAEKTERREQAFFVRLHIPAVEAEICTLCVIAEDPVSGASSRMVNSFTIE
jgi:VWFA-related protein